MASLTTLRSRLSAMLRDPNNRVRPTTTIDYAINAAQNKLQAEFGSMVDDATYTVSTVAGTQEYNLPSDFNRLQFVSIDGSPLERKTLKSLREMYHSFTQGVPNSYYLRPGVIGLYPIPSTTQSLYLLYNTILPTITTSQDSTTPAILDDALLYRAAAICYRQVNRADMANIREIEYEKEKNKAMVNLMADENLYR